MAYTPKTWTTGETIDKPKLDAIEQGLAAAAAAADTANSGLTSKVNSSTYTTGLAGKADLVSGAVPDAQLPARLSDASLKTSYVAVPTGGTDGQALVKSGAAVVWGAGSGGTAVTDNGDGTATA